MRLGSQRVPTKEGTLARDIYGAEVNERHRHRYEANNHYLERIEKAGIVVSAITPTEGLCEIMELPRSEHPFFIGVQFHPEFTSTPRNGHPLFIAFVKAALAHQQSSAQPPQGGGMKLCNFEAGLDRPFFLIAGPCVIESRELAHETAGKLKEITTELGIPFIYKSSFDKANRSSGKSFRGLGMDKGLEILADTRAKIGVPVLTDVHEIDEVEPVAAVVDVLQTPAFLCRQTDFIRACAQSGKPVNIKKGQFLAPHGHEEWSSTRPATPRAKPVWPTMSSWPANVGASFGYNNLVSDMRSLAIMRETGCPVVFDATHSVQLPGGQGATSGGQREFVPVLARAAIAVGVAGVFMETHPNPACAMSDGPNAVPLHRMRELLSVMRGPRCADQACGLPRKRLQLTGARCA